jgi:hypothetical protein
MTATVIFILWTSSLDNLVAPVSLFGILENHLDVTQLTFVSRRRHHVFVVAGGQTMTTLRKITAMTALTITMIVVGQASGSSSALAQHRVLPAASYQVAGAEGGDGGLLFGDGAGGDGGAAGLFDDG